MVNTYLIRTYSGILDSALLLINSSTITLQSSAQTTPSLCLLKAQAAPYYDHGRDHWEDSQGKGKYWVSCKWWKQQCSTTFAGFLRVNRIAVHLSPLVTRQSRFPWRWPRNALYTMRTIVHLHSLPESTMLINSYRTYGFCFSLLFCSGFRCVCATLWVITNLKFLYFTWLCLEHAIFSSVSALYRRYGWLRLLGVFWVFIPSWVYPSSPSLAWLFFRSHSNSLALPPSRPPISVAFVNLRTRAIVFSFANMPANHLLSS